MSSDRVEEAIVWNTVPQLVRLQLDTFMIVVGNFLEAIVNDVLLAMCVQKDATFWLNKSVDDDRVNEFALVGRQYAQRVL